ncbi:tail fiber family protein [Vibrio phage vB_VorS-PVo5]|nr:tail fiber family protein [Vibrio phage vB_VorS-PVo5]
MRVENLQAETTITENGERVYSPNNKPSPEDIGALSKTGKAANSAKADNANAALYITATDRRDVTPETAHTGSHKKVMRPFFVQNSALPGPYRPGGGYSDLLIMDTYSDATGGRVNALAMDKGANALYHVQGEQDGAWTTSEKVYTTAQKPTAADVGAHPTSWKPSWDDVQSKPAQATRWPKWGEISDKPGTMPPSSHTHPWSQITNIPSYATRWPNWGEIAGKPGNLLTQTTADTRYMSKNDKPNAATLDGQDNSFYRSGYLNEARRFYVGGDANTYYPVVITGHAGFSWARFSISRAFNDPAPNTWNTPTHKGGLTFTWEATGDVSWGGNDRNYRVLEFHETYTTTVAGMQLSVGGMVVWLRGGNARYELHGPCGVKQGVDVHLGTYKASDGKTYVPRKTVSPRDAEIHPRWVVRSYGEVYDRGNRVYSASNKPSAGDVGAYSKSEADSRYLRYHYSGSTSYASIVPPKSNWVRSPTSGFLPYSNGSASLGTNGWRWKDIHGVNIYQNGQKVYSPTNKPSAATIGAEPKLPIDRKRKITYGTGNPSGGSDGDVYIQY